MSGTKKKESDSYDKDDKRTREEDIKPKEDGRESQVGATSSHQDTQDKTKGLDETQAYCIDNIYNTVLNHTFPGNWGYAKKVWLIYKIDDDTTAKIITNISHRSGDTHAEKVLIDELNERKEKAKKTNNPSGSEPDVSHSLSQLSVDESDENSKAKKSKGTKLSVITVYQNNSPCSSSQHNCTKALINYLEENTGDSLKLYVTNLFKIRRNSCTLREEGHLPWVKYDDHKASYNGLRELMRHKRCEIKAYTKKDWLELLKVVPVSVPDETKQLIDEYYCTKIGNNDRSREEEDTLIQDDLNHIRDNEL